MPIYKEFLGMNYCIYDPCADDLGSVNRCAETPEGSTSNTLGYCFNQTTNPPYWYTSPVGYGNVSKLTRAAPSRVMILLNLHRNGNWGYGSWKQTRVSHNHLSRYHKRNSEFTWVQQPGESREVTINQKTHFVRDRFSGVKIAKEPVVCSSYKPLQLIGKMTFFNPKTNQNELKSVSIKTTFSNDTVFFANDVVNKYYNTIVDTDESYEEMKDLYLDGGLSAASSPIEEFNRLIYRQTIFPKMKFSYLKKTHTRDKFVNLFWRDSRNDRNKIKQNNRFGIPSLSQSLWLLDMDHAAMTGALPGYTSILGYSVYHYRMGGIGTNTWLGDQWNSQGYAGQLQNTYSHLYKGAFNLLTQGKGPIGAKAAAFYSDPTILLSCSALYSRKHTLQNMASLVGPTGMFIHELWGPGQTAKAVPGSIMDVVASGALFAGEAPWDAGRVAGKDPFYDSYDAFASDLSVVGKDYAIIPEFKISSHVKTYEEIGITEELKSIFELSGAHSQNTTTENYSEFYSVLSNSDFLKHFDLIKEDHKDFVDPSLLTLKVKAIKKFLPYDGFYPAQRCLQLSQQFYSSYSDYITFFENGQFYGNNPPNYAFQSFIEPLFAPGVLFNSIKSGIAVDYPLILDSGSLQTIYVDATGSYNPANDVTSVTPGPFGPDRINVLISGSRFQGDQSQFGNLNGIFDKRIPFEALVAPDAYLAGISLVTQEPHPFGLGDAGFSAIWNGGGSKTFPKMMSNFLAEVPEMFIKNQNFTSISSLESQDPNFGQAVSGNFYAMRVKMYRSTNKPGDTLKGFGGANVKPPQDLYGNSHKFGKESAKMRETFTMYSRPSAFGPAMFGGKGFTWVSSSAQTNTTGSWGKVTYLSGNTYATYGTNANFPLGQGGAAANQSIIGNRVPYGRFVLSGSDSTWGYNWAYTPPYYHGEAWCDLIFECTESKKYSAEEIIQSVKNYPYFSRFWWNGINDALRDLTGYRANGENDDQDGYIAIGQSMVAVSRGDANALLPGGASRYKLNPLRGKYEGYDVSPWHNLIKKAGWPITSDSKNTTIGPVFLASGAKIPLGDNYYKVPANTLGGRSRIEFGGFDVVKGNGDFFINGQGTCNWSDWWGNRWSMGNYKNRTGSWAGPPSSGYVPRIQRSSSAPYHPYYLNMNAMQLDSSLNLFGLGSVRKRNLKSDGTNESIEVATSQTTAAKSRWIIQTKFETPMLNFNKYSNLTTSGCTVPTSNSASVTRGMWHQYGEIPTEEKTGVFLQVEDMSPDWLMGALGVHWADSKKMVRSLADLVGMPKTPTKLGKVADVKQIAEAVVAVPFLEINSQRKFFTIPREDIDEAIGGIKREVEPGVFVAGGPPKVGNTVLNMVKKMQKFNFPPSMDFVKYPQIQPFAMYVFEFTHNLSKKDLADIWQNLPPDVGVKMETAEASISHELLAHELLGAGAEIKGGKLNESAKADQLNPEMRWMVFKVKQKARTNYWDKIVAKKGSTADTSGQELENVDNADVGENPDVTYNWPYDFFSLVELVKIDAEITFANVETDPQGDKIIDPVKKPDPALEAINKRMSRGISKAIGNPGETE